MSDAVLRNVEQDAELLDLFADLVLHTDDQGRLTRVSGLAEDLLGSRPGDLIGRFLSDLGRFLDNGPQPARRPFHDRPFQSLGRDGTPHHLKVTGLPHFDPATGAFTGMRIAVRDETDRHTDTLQLKTLSRVLERTSAAVIITNRQGIIQYVNQAFTKTSGYSATEALGRTPAIQKSGNMPVGFYRDMWRTLLAGEEWRGELYNRRKSGEGYWERAVISPVLGEGGTITHFVAVKENITERKRAEQEMLDQGYRDQVTGLPTRLLAMDRLEQAMTRARRDGTRVALLSLDMDHFNRVNDIVGFVAADRILNEIGQRLAATVPPEDTVARLGGDEFGVVAGLRPQDDAEGLVQRIIRCFHNPFRADGHEFFLSPSMGVSLYPEDGIDGSELLRNVEAALSRAKEMGGGTVQFFTPDMTARSAEYARLGMALHNALDRGEIEMHYQPMVDVASGRIIGAEALMRWNSPDFGTVPPDRFIPLAEASGVIVSLGRWAMITACAQTRIWQDRFGHDFRMAVNVSTRQVHEPGFARMVGQAIAEAGIAPSSLEIEITESLLMDDGAQVAELTSLRDEGVRLSIDDFGTGYSSLSYLRRFPIDTLKIDRSFLANLVNNGIDQTLVTTIIAMAHSLGLAVVAEGVETDLQFTLLRDRGCDLAQGYLFSHPVPAALFGV